MSTSIRVIDTLEGARSIADEWRELALAAGARSPFGRPEVALAWAEHLNPGTLRIATCRANGGSLIGLAPLYSRPRGGFHVVGIIGTGVGAVGEVLVHPDHPGEIAAELLEAAVGWRTLALDLQNCHEFDAGMRELENRTHLGLRSVAQDVCPVIELGTYTSSDAFLDVPQRSGLRKKIRRYRRRLDERSHHFHVASTPDDVRTLWRDVQPLFDRSEEQRPRQHFGQGHQGAFFRSLLSEMAASESAWLTALSVEGTYVAFDVYLRTGTRAFAVLGRMDAGYGDLSPGQLLTAHGIDLAIERGIDEIDLQLGEDLYKQRWATSSYKTFRCQAGHKLLLPAASGLIAGADRAFQMRTAWRHRRADHGPG